MFSWDVQLICSKRGIRARISANNKQEKGKSKAIGGLRGVAAAYDPHTSRRLVAKIEGNCILGDPSTSPSRVSRLLVPACGL